VRTLGASVLVSEALVVFFAVLVAKDLSGVDGSVVWAVGGGVALGCVLVAGLLGHPWAYVAGSVLQVLVVATGFAVPAMFFLGAVFAGLWVLALVLGRRVQRLQAARAGDAGGPGKSPGGGPGSRRSG
jgi:hypothetical protein